jgi:hypothetical protein
MADVVPARWTSVECAADLLGMTSGALRKMLERNARRGEDGVTEALVSGVRARKLGRLWRVSLSAAWAALPVAERARDGVEPSSSQSVRGDREGPRS